VIISDIFTTKSDLESVLVAHRLRTVIDYDRLIVLDKGQVRLLLSFCTASNPCPSRRSQSLTRPSTSFRKRTGFSEICASRAGHLMNWRLKRKPRLSVIFQCFYNFRGKTGSPRPNFASHSLSLPLLVETHRLNLHLCSFPHRAQKSLLSHNDALYDL